MTKRERTEIAKLGQFGLIDRIAAATTISNPTTVKGIGDDAAVVAMSDDELLLTSTDSLYEGVDFDLTYFPLKHLGYKAVVVAVNDILAMNGVPQQLMLSLGLSSKLPVEAIDDLYEGVRVACKELDVDLVGGDTRASMTGLVISLTAIGRVAKDKIAYRSGAKPNDLICITGNVGAAYMGLQLLEREKRVLHGVENPQPQFEGYEYLLEQYLKPTARLGMVSSLAEEGIVPTSMIDLSDGLASDLLQICRASKCGARIYLERIPIAKATSALAAELNSDPVVAALNGGEDHELLFTVPLEKQELIMKLGCIDIIGHITEEKTGAFLVTPDGSDIALRSQGFPDGLPLE
ncbi:MAG: thiamine-phosphate kinase [Rikenellaceae bacterium]